MSTTENLKEMEFYLKISYLNYFGFCPLSIYYHQLYGELSERLYYGTPQLDGKVAHKAIDEKRYSTHKNILQGIDVYSNKYKLCGKIDIFDIEKGLLTERKNHINVLYERNIFQIYGQYVCLVEMGYTIKQLRFYSSDDNKVYPIPLPEDDLEMFEKFKVTNKAMLEFDIENFVQTEERRCCQCIYNDFCDRPLAPKSYNGGF